MNHSLSLASVGRRQKWLQLNKSRRPSSMVLPLREQVKILQPRVYCDPKMPDNWNAISD